MQAKLRCYQGPHYDAKPLHDAKKLAHTLQTQYHRASSERRENIQQVLKSIEAQLAERIRSMGEFYSQHATLYRRPLLLQRSRQGISAKPVRRPGQVAASRGQGQARQIPRTKSSGSPASSVVHARVQRRPPGPRQRRTARAPGGACRTNPSWPANRRGNRQAGRGRRARRWSRQPQDQR